MALPLIPLAAAGAVALFLLTRSKESSAYSQAPSDGSAPPTKEPPPNSKSWQEMPQALQEQVAAALGALGVSPATGELSGSPVSADAIKLATQTAALCESQGFYDVAKELRRLIAKAAPTVATPPEAAPIKAAAPPGLSPAQIEAIARTLTLDRDPAAIQALIVTLQKLPPSPERDHFIEMASALLLQLQAAQSTTQTMQQIDQVIKSPGIAAVNQSVKPLPAVAIPVLQPPAPVILQPSILPFPVAPTPAPVLTSPIPTAAAVTRATLKALTGTRVLQSGSTGNDVAAWQQILRLDGFAVTVDKKYGPATVAATKSWQQQRGIGADGKVGPATRAKIGSLPIQDKALPATPAKAPVKAAPAAVSPALAQFPDPSPAARTLARGMKGEDVKSWQRILTSFGYPMGTFGPDKDGIDGDYGATAEKQTRAFQQFAVAQKWVPASAVDGKVGPITRRLVLLRLATQKRAA